MKRERLPLFLESDLYVEYRLAKLVSQVKAASSPHEHVSIELDYSPNVRPPDEEEEVKEPEEDEGEVCYCLFCLTMCDLCVILSVVCSLLMIVLINLFNLIA